MTVRRKSLDTEGGKRQYQATIRRISTSGTETMFFIQVTRFMELKQVELHVRSQTFSRFLSLLTKNGMVTSRGPLSRVMVTVFGKSTILSWSSVSPLPTLSRKI